MKKITEPTKKECEEIEREIRKSPKRRIRRAVNPERGYGC